jgi:hypothetical protein
MKYKETTKQTIVHKGWKYAQLLVEERDLEQYSEAQYIIVELYSLGPEGEYDAFCVAHLQTVEDLKRATRDIERDGINTWFYENGTFEWKRKNHEWVWDWTKNTSSNQSKPIENDDVVCDWNVTPYGEQIN